MPLPSSVAEQTRWEPSRVPGWSGRLLMFSLTVFLVSVMSYLGLALAYKPNLDKREAEYKKKVEQQSQKISSLKQEEIVAFYSQIENVKKLLQSHVQASRVFELLEEKTLPTIAYGKFGLASATNEVKLTGTTRSFAEVSKQAEALSEDARVRDVAVGNVTSDAAGNWNFDFVVTLAPSVLADESLDLAPSGASQNSAGSPASTSTGQPGQ